ncbi:MAG: cupin domain-containing protein [Deltaproteobacteria bacterium]|nr:MAG: cupin domain-containing protein [Deltaproteobacteria bacterium]
MVHLDPVNWEEMEWELVRPGVKRKVFHAEGCTLALNALEPTHQPKPHSHPYEQVVYIVQGETEFTVGAKVSKLIPGSLLVVPPNVEHFARVTGHETCMNLDVFVPRREDYVQSKIKE